MEYDILIAPDGTTRFIYDDVLKPLLENGQAVIRRASHVEPKGNLWGADMSPVGGPSLGFYRYKKDALEAEREWLVANGIPFPEGG